MHTSFPKSVLKSRRWPDRIPRSERIVCPVLRQCATVTRIAFPNEALCEQPVELTEHLIIIPRTGRILLEAGPQTFTLLPGSVNFVPRHRTSLTELPDPDLKVAASDLIFLSNLTIGQYVRGLGLYDLRGIVSTFPENRKAVYTMGGILPKGYAEAAPLNRPLIDPALLLNLAIESAESEFFAFLGSEFVVAEEIFDRWIESLEPECDNPEFWEKSDFRRYPGGEQAARRDSLSFKGLRLKSLMATRDAMTSERATRLTRIDRANGAAVGLHSKRMREEFRAVLREKQSNHRPLPDSEKLTQQTRETNNETQRPK